MMTPKPLPILWAAIPALLVACGTAEDLADPKAQAEGPVAEQGAALAAQRATVEAQVLTLVNQARAVGRSCGSTYYAAAPALTRDARLDAAAVGHSADMAANHYLDSIGHDGSTPDQRLAREGYNVSGCGETIAAGHSTASAVVNAWLASPLHCSILMTPAFTHAGIGRAFISGTTYPYWTMDFAWPL